MRARHIAGLFTLLLIILVSGCGEAPVQKPAQRFIYETGQTPYSAAICIARNARRSSESVQAEERLLGDSSTEVVVRSQGETLAVAEVVREGIKSRVSIRVIQSPENNPRSFARLLMTNC